MSSFIYQAALGTPGHLCFPNNHSFAADLKRAGGRVVRQANGHLIFYRSDGRRFLATDPSGSPLHECEWGIDATGQVTLFRARIRLDWGQWIGLKPAGLINETILNLARNPRWQSLTTDDLRDMAAQALQVSLEEIKFFYRDSDFLIDLKGQATIRQRKDAFYVLEGGDFERARFMSCMGAMNWCAIDFLPVVELFQSLLPGTGSAVFELIRGLYDDQNEGNKTPQSIRYRGIPTYPSEAAFYLFSSFFTAHVSDGKSPFAHFMNPDPLKLVTWLPAGSPPLRYFDQSLGACLTFQSGVLEKVTLSSDSSGISYFRQKSSRYAPCDRTAVVRGGYVILRDRVREVQLKVTLPDQCVEQSEASISISPVDWRSVFVQGEPLIPPATAYGAVLLYPEDETEIDEYAAQPFVADYLQDIGEQNQRIRTALLRAEHVLIDNGDAVIRTCIMFDRSREYTVSVRSLAFAQKQAQQLWSIGAELGRWEWLSHIRFVTTYDQSDRDITHTYDLVYSWVAYGEGEQPGKLIEHIKWIRQILRQDGNAFIVGPAEMKREYLSYGIQVYQNKLVERLPTFQLHRAILPKAKLRTGLTLFHIGII